ncbi:unnamed protein product, partial [Hapterophycus canaliculatus]
GTRSSSSNSNSNSDKNGWRTRREEGVVHAVEAGRGRHGHGVCVGDRLLQRRIQAGYGQDRGVLRQARAGCLEAVAWSKGRKLAAAAAQQQFLALARLRTDCGGRTAVHLQFECSS